jgi:hypothetical protein
MVVVCVVVTMASMRSLFGAWSDECFQHQCVNCYLFRLSIAVQGAHAVSMSGDSAAEWLGEDSFGDWFHGSPPVADLAG